jgi:hypothetical protein
MHIRAVALAVTLSLVSSSIAAAAVCDQTRTSQAERDLWNTHGCWQAFFLWQYQAYDMRQGDWTGRGWEDACNQNMEYPKHWNASYLLTYGRQLAVLIPWYSRLSRNRRAMG